MIGKPTRYTPRFMVAGARLAKPQEKGRPPVTMPSNLIIAAVTAFRNLVNSIQGTEDPGQQLRQTTTSLGEVANVLEKLAASTAAHEQQFGQMDQRLGQTAQQVQNLQEV